MMGWWSSSASSALDEQIAKATSSSLEDIALNLEISDVVRSKTVPPKEAMRSLKKRIGDKNPNTQLSALNVRLNTAPSAHHAMNHTCVKNGGQHFLTEIASREFMDNLVSLLKAVGPASVNQAVRAKILEYIQSWAAATEGRYELNYIGEVYKTLEREGFQFPPKTAVSSSMIDSSARHSSSMQPRNARVDDSFDEDLKKALAMSLEEVQSHQKGRGYVPPTTNGPSPDAKVNGHTSSNKETEEEDADLKAAIAASLFDMEEQKKKHAAILKEQTTAGGANASSSTFTLPKNDYELTPVEAENINLFSTLVDRLQTQPQGTILREPQIQELYDSIGTLRPKLARTYGETMSKHDTLLDLHAKLQTAVRYYDRMLEERLSKAFHHQNIGGYNLPRQASSPYSTIQAGVPISHVGPAESFYGAEQPLQDYGRPLAQSSYPHPSQPTPQPQYATYDKRASLSGPSQHTYPPQQQQPRQDSWAASAPPTQYPPPQNYTPSEAATPQMGHLSLPQQQPSAPESVGTTPTTDPTSSFYFQQASQNQQSPPSAPTEVAQSPYPNLQQSIQQYSQQAQPIPETPAPASHAQAQQQQQHLSQQQAPPQPQPQQPTAPYWQHPAAQHVPVPVPSSAPWQQHQQPPQYVGYQQEAFPSAPQHIIAPQQPAVEEALIEL
ncbi:Vacuolar protein-sorting-associated protein 27 [Cytospora paraplurivora]|uniref:Vacuolar protein sorting-associated protein 27 n=1 Tax=Cytospora paraplurivora TaxID=2898453 RepID=A0AAN9U9X8_9PEZI